MYDSSNHPRITAMHDNNSIELNGKFGFQKVTSEKVEKIMNKINVKKATDADGIPAKIVKASKSVIVPQLSTLINITVDTGVFPDRLQKAQVTPLFKKNYPLVISNYRTVSILPIFSKLFEKVTETQLNDFFDSIFSPYLCAFRRGHGCQTTLGTDHLT